MYRHREDHDQRPFEVRLNGRPVSDVVWADDAGTVVLYAHDRQGNRLPRESADPDQGIGCHGGWETVRCQGQVEITCGPEPTPTVSGQYDFSHPEFYCCGLEKNYAHWRQIYNFGGAVIPAEWVVLIPGNQG